MSLSTAFRFVGFPLCAHAQAKLRRSGDLWGRGLGRLRRLARSIVAQRVVRPCASPRAVRFALKTLRSALCQPQWGVALLEGTTRSGVAVRGTLRLSPLTPDGGDLFSVDHTGPVHQQGRLFRFRLGHPVKDPSASRSYRERAKWHAAHKLLVSCLATEVLVGRPLVRWLLKRLPGRNLHYESVETVCKAIKAVCTVARRWGLRDRRDPEGDRRFLEREGLSLSRSQALQFSYWGRALPAPVLDRKRTREVADEAWGRLHLSSPDPRQGPLAQVWRRRTYRMLQARPRAWRWEFSLSEAACLESKCSEGGQRAWLLAALRHPLPPSSFRARCEERRAILLLQARDMSATDIPWIEPGELLLPVPPPGTSYAEQKDMYDSHVFQQPRLDGARRQAEAIYWTAVGFLGPQLDHALVCPFWDGEECQSPELHPPTALLPLEEDGFKVRVATLHEASLVFVARAWGSPGFATLRSLPSERNGVVGEPTSAMADHLGTARGTAVSLDLSAATDMFSMFAARDVLLALTTPLRRGVEDESVLWSPLEDRAAVVRLLSGPLRPVSRAKLVCRGWSRTPRPDPFLDLEEWSVHLAVHAGVSVPAPRARVPGDRSGLGCPEAVRPRPRPVPYLWQQADEAGAGAWAPLHPGRKGPVETRPPPPIRWGNGSLEGYDQAWVPLEMPLTSRGVSMALGCHWPSMALVGWDSSRRCRHLGCGDDGLDVGSKAGHREATVGREQAGFERNPGKEVESLEGALIKEIPFRRHEGRWEVLSPLKIRVLSGEGDPETGPPRFIGDLDSLEEECRRSMVPEDLMEKGRQFLLERYGNPLDRLRRWGVGVAGTRGWRDFALSRPTPFGIQGPPFARPGPGGSGAEDALMAREAERVMDRGDLVPLTREALSGPLTWEIFSSWEVAPGSSPGAETLKEMMARLSRAMAPPVTTTMGYHLVGPKVVGLGGDFPLGPSSRLQRRKAFRRERTEKVGT